MLDFILDPINEFIRDMLKGWIEDNLSALFVQLNNNVAGVTLEVSQTPSTWNGSVFSIVQNLSETVIVPIAAVIITYVLCYELISMLIDRNNMHDFDTALFLKYIFKAGIAVFLLSKTSDIVMAMFDLGSQMTLNAIAAYHIVTRNGYKLISDLQGLTKKKLLTFRNCGVKSAEEIVRKAAEWGIIIEEGEDKEQGWLLT